MKLKRKTLKRIQGSVSVLLVIIMLPMMAFSALIVDMSRINMAKQMMSSAGDLSMNTALANYDTILKDVYGLFAMSQEEGWDNDTLGTELNQYFAETLCSYGVVSKEESKDYVEQLIGDFTKILDDGNYDTTNFLELSNIDLQATKVDASSLANASVMRKQVVEYMKYRAPLGVGMSFLESLTAFEKVDDQNKVVEAQVKAQESTQDVTQACKTLIKMIRDYDKRILELDKAVTGVANSKDGIVVPLEDYDTHVEKYLSVWGENYEHINKLNLVFLANSPSVDSVYLKSLSYPSQCFVKTDGTVYQGTNTGISISVPAAADTAAAKTNVENQIANLNNNYDKYINMYTQSYLKSSLLTYSANNIQQAVISKSKEEDAIKSFIAFEKFLLNKGESGALTYDQVKSVLEQIYTLDQYRKDFENKINIEIDAATARRNAAQGAYDSLVSQRDGAGRTMDNRIQSINTTLTGFVSQYENIDAAVAFLSPLGASNQRNIKNAITSLPARGGSYANYYAAYMQYGDSDKYARYFKWLINDSAFATSTDEDIADIIEYSQKFINSQNGNYDTNGYRDYMCARGRLNSDQQQHDLFKLLSCLKTCHAYAITYKNNIATYNNANNQIPAAEEELRQAKAEVNRLNAEKTNVLNSIKLCLQDYNAFCFCYQGDAYYYNYFKQAAKNTIEPEVKAIQGQYSKILANLAEAREDLNAISDQITDVLKPAIQNYKTNLQNWENKNNTYSNENGGDSFSDQTAEDIEKAKTEYDEKLYDTLDLFVVALWNEFDDLYSKLEEDGNFVYGSKKIKDITTAQNLIDAVSGTTFSDVVTVEEATTKLATLYKAESLEYVPYTMDYEKQLCFLQPRVLQIQALKYLHNAYPDDTQLSDEQKTKNEQTQKEYEASKNKLTGNDTTVSSDGSSSEGSAEHKNTTANEEAKGDFGYSYESKSVSGGVPSKAVGSGATSKEVKDEEYLLKEEGEGDDKKLNASTGVGDQTKKSNDILKDIGKTANTALENLYILNYVFENFSYNTIVQEQIIKDNPLQNNTVLLQIAETEEFFNSAEKIAEAKKKTTTLSNYSINEKNNYLYGAEIEYILFGNSTAKKNVTSAKASIYAIRFGFNCIFAFTDSEIRNTTMSAGLAVQAATLGIVPYQVVQIVLQLALAAAESAIDLSAMNHGLKVAIIKTKDTWSLSLSGASEALKDVGNAAAQMVTNELSGMVMSAIDSFTGGLNDVLSAGADDLKGALTNLKDGVDDAAKGVLESVVDQVLTSLMADIEEGLNSLQYVNVGRYEDGTNVTVGEIKDQLPTKADVQAAADAMFNEVRGNIDGYINEACGNNAMAQSLAPALKTNAEQLIKSLEDEVRATINSATDGDDITGIIAGKLNDFKQTLIDKGNQFVGRLTQTVADKAADAVDATQQSIQGYIDQCGDDLKEDAAQLIKDEVSTLTNGFIDNTLKVSGSTSAATDVKSSPVAMFKFGYKDYLMILTYISICCGDSVLLRTADAIQLNLQNAGEGADIQHPVGKEFTMSKANTYISVTATADLDMFFMDFGLFQDMLETGDGAVSPEAGTGGSSGGTAATTEDKAGTSITYKGLLGY